MPDMKQIAMMMLQRNPNIANSPQGQQFMQILKNDDAEKGQQMAQNFCQSYGVKPEDALKQAKQFFNL